MRPVLAAAMAVALAVVLVAASNLAYAGTPCEGAGDAPDSARPSLETADAARTRLEPTGDEVALIARLGARVSKANVSFDDHPPALRWRGHIQAVTVDSVVTWLRTLPNGCLAMGCPERRIIV